MTHWKEHGYLFTNGKFKCIVGGFTEPTKIIGHRENLWLLDNGYDATPAGCTLIARSIEDMADEELGIAHYISDTHNDVDDFNIDEWRRILKQWISLDEIKFATARYLLSVGVYPLPDTEGVIFKPKDK